MTALPPPIVSLSKLEPSPEPYWTWYRPFSLMLIIVVMIVSSVLTIPLIPLLIVGTLYRRYKVRTSKYHTHPKDVRIAVIGGGWSGLQIVQRLHELGVEKIQGFESMSDFGGGWDDSIRYYGQSPHAPMYVTNFASHQYPTGHCKIDGSHVLNYIRDFAATHELHRFYEFGTTVSTIHYDSTKTKTPQATVEIQTRGKNSCGETKPKMATVGPFDMIIHTSKSCHPCIPTFKGQETFEGTILHSRDFTQDIFQNILEKKQKVAIIGGGKAALDLLLPFQRIGFSSVSWIYRNAYLFCKLELFFGQPSARQVLIGFSNLVAIISSIVSARLPRWMFWWNGVAWTYDATPPMHVNKAKFGIVDSEQRRHIQAIDRNRMFRSSIGRIEPKGIRLDSKDKEFVPADVILLATSYHKGLDRIHFTKNGESYDLLDGTKTVFNFFSVRDYPVLSFDATLLSFGPMRARATADLAVYHLCLQQQNLSESDMARLGRFQFGPGMNIKNEIYASIEPHGGVAYALTSCTLSLILSGLVDVWSLSKHVINFMCFSYQDDLDIGILPKLVSANTNDATETIQ